MTANATVLQQKIFDDMKPSFAALGLELTQFVVENISLPDDLQRSLDQRIGMNIVGDLDKYTQFAAAQSMTVAAANTGGGAGIGMGLGAGAAVAQVMASTLHAQPAAVVPVTVETAGTSTKFCIACGHSIPQASHFCPDCGKPQQ
jgi:membrane protease subunit (stomatin/prohibitin family)